MRRVQGRRRVEGTGTRRTVVATKASDVVALDDRPLAIHQSRDRKRLFVVLPYEVWILDARELTRLRVIEVDAAHPSVAEDQEGVLWLGGRHLYRGSTWAAGSAKAGSRLGGFVDRIVLLRPGLVCGVGSQGEVIWSVAAEAPEHRRKAGEQRVFALVATADERAVWADGSASAWVIDPAHPQGYMQIRMRATSAMPATGEGIVALGLTSTGRCVLAARDGGVAWTAPDLRLAGERFPRPEGSPEDMVPLDVAGDERWIYVLRPRGLLQRFLIAQPTPPKKTGEERRRAGARGSPQAEAEPWPGAQSCRLRRSARCLTLLSEDAARRLVLAGSHSDDQLGHLWCEDPESLAWKPLASIDRAAAESPAVPAAAAPRSRPSGPRVAEIRVDAVLSADPALWVVAEHGAVAERPALACRPDQVLAGDTVLLPAMIRLHEGTARPALVVWPAARDAGDAPARSCLFTWGDRPAGWISLQTPEIRRQRWSRTDVFPLEVALAAAPPALAGKREAIPTRWIDPERFAALARECRKLLKVLW